MKPIYLTLYRKYRLKYGPPGPIPPELVKTLKKEEPLAELEELIEPEMEELIEPELEELIEPEMEELIEPSIREIELKPIVPGVSTCYPYREKAAYYARLYRIRPIKIYLCYYYRFMAAYYCCLFKYTKNRYYYYLCQLYTRKYLSCMS